MDEIILQGGGEHARVVLDCLQSCNVNVVAIFDPQYNGSLFGVPQRGQYDSSLVPGAKAIVAIGDNATRKRVVGKTTHAFGTAVHGSAIVSDHARYGVGSMILHGAIIQAQTRIGEHCIINTRAQVDDDCEISDFVHIAPGAVICGTVQVGEGAFVGGGAVIIPGKKIGAWATIGAGAVVVSDVPDYAVVVGNPAKIISYRR